MSNRIFSKKMIALLLTILIACTCTMHNVSAKGDENYLKELSQITTTELSTYALNVAKTIYPDLQLETGEMIPIYNNYNQHIGYSISYCMGTTPYGYINLDFSQEDPVTEFVINENTDSLYDSVKSTVTDHSENLKFTNRLYNTAPMEFAIDAKTNKGDVFFTRDNSFSSEEFSEFQMKSRDNFQYDYDESQTVKYDSHNELFSSSYESGSTVTSGPTYMKKYSSSKSCISEKYVLTNTSKYACAVVALTEIANQEGILLNSSVADTFNELWDKTGTTVVSEGEYNNITVAFGSTANSKLPSGMKSYCKDRGKENTYTTADTSPDYSFFKNSVDNNYSTTLSYNIYLSDGTKSGHTINVVGYCVAEYSGTKSNYLIVDDGWYTTPKYFNYSNVDFASSYGVRYVIK